MGCNHYLVGAVATLLSLTLLLKEADACSCLGGLSFCDLFQDADVVLRGTVLDRTEGPDINDDTVYDIITTEIFKGEPDVEYAVDMSFNLTTGGNSAQCGIYLDIGVEYVIDLFRNEFFGDRLQAQGLCGLVRPWSSVTAQEEEFLRESCESYDPCEGTCGDFQECLTFFSFGSAAEYYCADFCDVGVCGDDEQCQLLPTPCYTSTNPCPPVASCTPSTSPPTPAPALTSACDCGEFQECLVYTEAGGEEPYCADTCAPGRCGEDETCSLEEVTCVRAPCPPVAVCTAATPYEYVGCFKDTKDDRVLSNTVKSTEMTTELCLNHCEELDAAYMATQYGTECWCYLTGRSDFERHGDGAVCDFPCEGDEGETCGGHWAFSLYKLDWPEAPTDDPEFVGCYRDVEGDRVMTDKISDDMTPSVCREYCSDKGALYYGTQYSFECWCGYSDEMSDYTGHGEGVCHLPCSGIETISCGGNYAFDLFKYNADE